jgi:thiamine biosynthesis lipoprotein
MPRHGGVSRTLVHVATTTLVFACTACLHLACAAKPATRQVFLGHAMGARVEITIDESNCDAGRNRARTSARLALVELERVDALLSDWKPSSELTALNNSNDACREVGFDLRDVLARSLEVADASDGLFDPTIGLAVHAWRESRASRQLPSADALEAARRLVDWRAVTVDGTRVCRVNSAIALDFGGIGKGYGAVRALAVLKAAGCPRALVALAGDIAAGDAPRDADGWLVEIAPEAAALRPETLVLRNAAVSTSGSAIQYVEIDGTRYAHIVDPRTGLGATSVAQVTVVGPLDCAVDALGTALALSRDNAEAAAVLARFPGYRARIERDGTVAWIGDGERSRGR